jgi:type IV pilus assembly protein PilY1
MQKTIPFAQIKKSLLMLSCVLGTMAASIPAYADDTEVFFSSAHGSTLSKSNILFVLDNSGSMGYGYDDSWRWGADYSTPDPGINNRLSDLISVMDSILADIKNVNIGLMTFTYDCLGVSCSARDNYAKILNGSEVKDIDLPAHRANLRAQVGAMLPRTNTPITAALYEAAQAMLEGTKGRPLGTTAQYNEVIKSECQQNHIVLLSDGVANSSVPKAGIEALFATNTSHDLFSNTPMTCAPVAAAAQTGEYCGRELAWWLGNTDHTLETPLKKKPITLHTISFAMDQNGGVQGNTFLEDLATFGNGGFYDAGSADELADAFNTILTEVKDVDTTFVKPIANTDQLNRLSQSDDLYVGMFTPSLKTRWDGNLKRYKLEVDNLGNVIIKDNSTPPQNAVSNDTGFFKDSSKSIWSATADGADVTKGGAASKIDHTTRQMYTYVGDTLLPANIASPVNLASTDANSLTALKNSNPALLPSLFNLPPTDSAEFAEFIDWVRGSDTEGHYNDPSNLTNSRKHIGDILHSSPVLVNYEHANGPLIFFGTNEGFLHAVDTIDGTEEYSFIPKELLPNLNKFRENSRDIPHPYGLDGPITLMHFDKASADFSEKDGDGLVNNNETAMLYFGMRRGGRDYYAMDVSSRDKPKLRWQIKGGPIPGVAVNEFAALGQSWSKPTAARIRFRGEIKNVLIFGGGYDENQDPTKVSNLTEKQTFDSMGNAIYIVDANNGKLIWKADRNSQTKMNYSIPSDIRVLDIDGDGLSDRMYVGDMGGQVWRFDINSGHTDSETASTLVYGGVMAELGGNGIDGARRFYSQPDVALINKAGEHFMSVSIGTGWRAHPRNTGVDDRFYMLRDNRPLEKIMDSANFGAKSSPGNTPAWVPTKESDLRLLTDEPDNNPLPDPDGWVLPFDTDSGEKSLNSSLTINNQLVFASYTPEVHNDDCLPASDSTSVYAVDILRGNPIPFAGLGGDPEVTTRKETIMIDGIPPSPTAVIKKNDDGTYSTGVVLGTKTILPHLNFGGLTKRTYWHDRRRGVDKPEEVESAECAKSDRADTFSAATGINPDGAGGGTSCSAS